MLVRVILVQHFLYIVADSVGGVARLVDSVFVLVKICDRHHLCGVWSCGEVSRVKCGVIALHRALTFPHIGFFYEVVYLSLVVYHVV